MKSLEYVCTDILGFPVAGTAKGEARGAFSARHQAGGSSNNQRWAALIVFSHFTKKNPLVQ